MLNLQTKRGCPFKCVYCTYPAIEGDRFRFYAPRGSSRETAKTLQEAGAKYLYLARCDVLTEVAETQPEGRESL